MRPIRGYRGHPPRPAGRGERLSAETLSGLDGADKIYLQAPGGFGKTSFLLHLLLAAINAGYVPFYLDAGLAKNLPDAVNDDGLKALFDGCTVGGRFQDFQKAAANDPATRAAIILDGVNENVAETAKVIGLANFLARNYGTTNVYVADRMTRRRDIAETFKLATILPIDLDGFSDGPIHDALSTAPNALKKLLSTPFFLDLYLRLREKSAAIGEGGRAAMLRDYFREYALPDPSDDAHPDAVDAVIAKLSDVAIAAYRTSGLQFPGHVHRQHGRGRAEHFSMPAFWSKITTNWRSGTSRWHDFLAGSWLVRQQAPPNGGPRVSTTRPCMPNRSRRWNWPRTAGRPGRCVRHRSV